MPENTLDDNQIIFDGDENEYDEQQELSLAPEKRGLQLKKTSSQKEQ